MIGLLKTILFLVGAVAIGRLVWIALAKQDAGDDEEDGATTAEARASESE